MSENVPNLSVLKQRCHSVTQWPHVPSNLIPFLPLTTVSRENTKAKGRLLFVTMLLLASTIFSLGVKFRQRCNISHIHILIKSKRRRDKSQGHKHISLRRIICVFKMHLLYIHICFKKQQRS